MSHNSDNWPLSVKKVTNISRLTVGIILVIAALSIPMKFKVKNIFKSTFWQSNIEYSDTWGRYIPALIGWRKGGNVTSAGWQVTLCDPIWHVSSCSGAVLVAQTAIRFLTLTYLYWFTSKFIFFAPPSIPEKNTVSGLTRVVRQRFFRRRKIFVFVNGELRRCSGGVGVAAETGRCHVMCPYVHHP